MALAIVLGATGGYAEADETGSGSGNESGRCDVRVEVILSGSGPGVILRDATGRLVWSPLGEADPVAPTRTVSEERGIGIVDLARGRVRRVLQDRRGSGGMALDMAGRQVWFTGTDQDRSPVWHAGQWHSGAGDLPQSGSPDADAGLRQPDGKSGHDARRAPRTHFVQGLTLDVSVATQQDVRVAPLVLERTSGPGSPIGAGGTHHL